MSRRLAKLWLATTDGLPWEEFGWVGRVGKGCGWGGAYVGDGASYRESQCCLLNTVVKKALKQPNKAGWEEGYPS